MPKKQNNKDTMKLFQLSTLVQHSISPQTQANSVLLPSSSKSPTKSVSKRRITVGEKKNKIKYNSAKKIASVSKSAKCLSVHIFLYACLLGDVNLYFKSNILNNECKEIRINMDNLSVFICLFILEVGITCFTTTHSFFAFQSLDKH